MPKKKQADTASAEDTRQNRGARPGDPSYQERALASEEEIALLGKPIDDRMAALLKDHQKMGVR